MSDDVDDLLWPGRLLAGGGTSTPDPRVLRALTTPVIGQFDPSFTLIMDDVVALARGLFQTTNRHCFPVSGLASAGLEALLNTLLQPGDRVAIGGGPSFVQTTSDLTRRCGADPEPLGRLAPGTRLVVVPVIDPEQGTRQLLADLARASHAVGAALIVEASLGLGAVELDIDDGGIDACVAGVEYAVGAPAGLSLLTYTDALAARMLARQTPPRTSYLDLLQVQAYWSAERVNHHTAPTSLVYGLREALRLIHAEGLTERWARHAHVADLLRGGLRALGFEVGGDAPFAIVDLATNADTYRGRLRDEYGISVTRLAHDRWRLGLLGADARPDAARQVLAALSAIQAPAGRTSIHAAIRTA